MIASWQSGAFAPKRPTNDRLWRAAGYAGATAFSLAVWSAGLFWLPNLLSH